jgi:hypothetical protein
MFKKALIALAVATGVSVLAKLIITHNLES